jgi:hypothetical protein
MLGSLPMPNPLKPEEMTAIQRSPLLYPQRRKQALQKMARPASAEEVEAQIARIRAADAKRPANRTPRSTLDTNPQSGPSGQTTEPSDPLPSPERAS